jgi:hypothetical protein
VWRVMATALLDFYKDELGWEEWRPRRRRWWLWKEGEKVRRRARTGPREIL